MTKIKSVLGDEEIEKHLNEGWEIVNTIIALVPQQTPSNIASLQGKRVANIVPVTAACLRKDEK